MHHVRSPRPAAIAVLVLAVLAVAGPAAAQDASRGKLLTLDPVTGQFTVTDLQNPEAPSQSALAGGEARSAQPKVASERVEPKALIAGGDFGGADLLPADGDMLSGTFTNVGTFLVPAGATVFVDPTVPLSIAGGDIVIDGVLDADGAGFMGGASAPDPSDPGNPGGGPGGGEGGGFGNCVHSGGGGGGGYGGMGGNSSSLFGDSPPPALGGPAYGDANPPGAQMGSGGGAGGNHCNATVGGPGGNGGGEVILTAGRITVSGTVTANGDDGVMSAVDGGAGGGGGSGGGIWLDGGCLDLQDGTFSAAGGAGAEGLLAAGFGMGGGGGAGGRIKLSGNLEAGSSFNASVAGGAPGPGATVLDESIEATPGEDGTVVDATAGACGVPVIEIPTVAPFGLIALGLLLFGAALSLLRRRRG